MTFKSIKIFLCLLLIAKTALADVDASASKQKDRHITSNQTREAYAQPFAGLSEEELAQFLRGRNRPDFQASGREWRTPPLWGIGLTESINEYQSYLHDGRAQTFAEAILWHGGEAEKVRARYLKLPRTQRESLDQFLLSL